MRRWISVARPFVRPPESLGVRVDVDRGSMAYSAVTQPFPVFLRKGGTFSSTLAVQITRVSPISMRTDPSAGLMKRLVIRTGLRPSAFLPSLRLKTMGPPLQSKDSGLRIQDQASSR